jgi:hypothetical protein
MKACHKVEHEQRPSFTSIKQGISDALWSPSSLCTLSNKKKETEIASTLSQ